ncbi:hypothetical protein ACGH7X_05625 [Streptomyces sp. BBFR51]|uniref:hypothetical protein n=1 Tax=Streptomyces sp. BBFR51 TaxID=3372856 RepID=UPI0037DBF545
MTTPPHAAGDGTAPDSAVRLVRRLTRAALHDQAAVPVLAAVVAADPATCLPLAMTTARCGAGPSTPRWPPPSPPSA